MRGAGGAAGVAVAGALLALARPEGLPIALAAGAAAWRCARARLARARAAGPGCPSAAGLVVAGLYSALVTGSWLGTSVADKSLLAELRRRGDGSALAAEYGVDVVRGLLLGLYPSEAPIGFSRGLGALLLPAAGACFWCCSRPCSRRTGLRARRRGLARDRRPRLRAGQRPNVFMGVHFNRYLLWAFPGLLALTAAGLGPPRGSSRARTRPSSGRSSAPARVALRAARRCSRPCASRPLYAEMAGEVWRRDVADGGLDPREPAAGRRHGERWPPASST